MVENAKTTTNPNWIRVQFKRFSLYAVMSIIISSISKRYMFLNWLILNENVQMWSLRLKAHFTYVRSVRGVTRRARNPITLPIHISPIPSDYSIRERMSRVIFPLIILCGSRLPKRGLENTRYDFNNPPRDIEVFFQNLIFGIVPFI